MRRRKPNTMRTGKVDIPEVSEEVREDLAASEEVNEDLIFEILI